MGRCRAYIKSLDRTVSVTGITFNPDGDVIYIFSAETGQDHYGHDVELLFGDAEESTNATRSQNYCIKLMNKETRFTGYVNEIANKVKSINPDKVLAECMTKEMAESIAKGINKEKYLVTIVPELD